MNILAYIIIGVTIISLTITFCYMAVKLPDEKMYKILFF